MDRLEAMALFQRIAERGSLSAAGRDLDMPLATVSRKLSDLEAYLKTRLVTRTTRRLMLTDAGRDYLAACRQILEQVEEAELGAAGAHTAVKGRLTVAAPVAFGRLHVLPVITEFLALHPEVDVRLLQGDRNVNLLEEHVDVAVRVGVLPDSSLIAKPVAGIGRVVVASPAHLARHGEPQTPQDLALHPCVSFEALTSPERWRFEVAGQAVDVPVHSRLSVNTADAALAAAEAGVGITRVLSYQAAEAVASGRLKRVLQAFEPATVPVSLVFPGQGRLPMKTRAFLDFAGERLAQRVGGS